MGSLGKQDVYLVGEQTEDKNKSQIKKKKTRTSKKKKKIFDAVYFTTNSVTDFQNSKCF